MHSFIDWFGPALAAAAFLILGALKLYGLRCGYEGGPGKPRFEYVCGSCPSWRSRRARLAVPIVCLAVGLVNLDQLVRLLWR